MSGRIAFAVFAIAVFGLSFNAHAQRAGERLYIWQETEVNPSAGDVSINMRDAPGAVRGLRVRTPDGSLKLSNVRVIYSDGAPFDERRSINLLPGERTRPINPTRTDRFVDQIILSIADDSPPASSVRVQILAHQTRRGRRLRRPDPIPTAEAGEETREVAAVQSSGSVLDTDREPDTDLTDRGEILFGAQRVGLALDRDTIQIPEDLARFERIRLRALENPVALTGLTLVYGDGSRETVAVEADLTETKFTPWLPVNANKFIDEILLSYTARSDFKGRARVEVFGTLAPGWLGMAGQARRYNEGWVLLGAQTAGFVGFDDDVVPISGNTGGFRQVRVRVRDRSITLDELQLVYADDTSDTVPVRARVDAGSTWGPFDLAEAGRPIREVRARYRSRFFDRAAAGRGAAIVEIWGRY